jgi:hypothetical protein
MIDDIFGDLSVFTLVPDTDDYTTETTETTDTAPSLIQDELFGDLSVFIIQNDSDEHIESSEILDYSNPIDPVAKGIECDVVIPLVETDDEDFKFSVKDLTESEKAVYDHIKSFNTQCKKECTNDMDIAELALIQNVDSPLFFNVSNDYLFRTPWDLSMSKFKNDYYTARNPKHISKKIIGVPVNYDSEYQTYLEEYKRYFKGRKKLNLTVQIGGIHQNVPKNIYCHWDMVAEELPLHFPHLRKTDTCVFERYLKDNGYTVKFELKDNGIGEVEYLEVARKNILQIPIFGHMLQADFMSMWQPKTPMYRYFERIISGRDQKNNLDGKKRLTGESDRSELLRPRIIVTELGSGEKYALEIPFHDSQSMHGIGKSLGDLAQVTNTPILDDKNIYTKEQKGRMLEVYLACKEQENRDNWRKYSVNSDLMVYQIFINNAKQFYNLYTDPEIDAGKYFTLPKPTIGRSVADIIAARILCKFESDVLLDLFSLGTKLVIDNTEKSVTKHDTKLKFIRQLKTVHKPDNDYDEILFNSICKQITHKFDINNDCYVVGLKPVDKLPKEIQQWIISTFCGGSSAMNIAGLSDSRRLNAKIQGGRCFRNRPLTIKDEGVIIDPDYDGAYSSFMRALDLPMCANPFRIEYDLKGKSQMLTLEQTRNKYKNELIPGMYQFVASHTDSERDAIDSKPKLLTHPQDLIASYHPHPSIKLTTVGSEWLEKSACSYVYTNQITNGIFTHWQLQIIDYILSKESRKEILDSKVTTGIIYRRSDKLETIRELLDGYRNYDGKNSYEISGQKEIITRDNFRGWVAFNLGELIVTPVRKLRSKYPKKTAENDFYKLIGNTVYGVLCSKYFPVSNVVTANNITSGVRTGVYCLEKGLNSHNSITDGGLANALTVAFANRPNKLNDKNIVQTHRLNNRELSKRVRYGVIGGYDSIQWTGIKADFCDIKQRKEHTEELLRFDDSNGRSASLDNNAARSLMDNLIFEHLSEQFPRLDIFHADFSDDNGNPRKGILRIECKGIAEACVVHGASNYLVRGGFHAMYPFNKNNSLDDAGKVFCAMRSYRKGYGSHAQLFMEQLGEHPDTVERSEVFDQSILLKVGLYQERYRSYFENSDYQVGDTFFMERLIREFPMSAYTCKSQEQRESWVREITMMRAKYGQSIESFFVNEDGQIDFVKMIIAFDMWIEAGYTCLADVFGDFKTAERQMKLCQSHPEYEKLKQRRLDKRQAKR